MKQRIEWVDRAKGIGIILVILGHVTFPNEVKTLLYSFHMPLFFFLAGYVYKINNNISFREYFIKKAKVLLLPAYFFTVINLIWTIMLSIINNGQVNINIYRKILGVFIQFRGSEFSTDGWFLICLFVSEIIMWIITQKYQDNKQLIGIALLISVIGYIYCETIGIVVPWALEVSLNAVAFLIIGYLFNKNSNKLDKLLKMKFLIIYILINIITCFTNYRLSNKHVDMYANNYGNYFLYITSAITGIIIVIILSKNILKFNELRFIGKSSLIYYCMHFKIITTISTVYKFSDTNQWYEELIIGFIYLIINLIVLHFISNFINNKAAFILGKFKRDKINNKYSESS